MLRSPKTMLQPWPRTALPACWLTFWPMIRWDRRTKRAKQYPSCLARQRTGRSPSKMARRAILRQPTTTAQIVSYTITDDGTTNGNPDPQSSTATVTVAISEINDPPSANPDTATVAEDSPGG